MEQIFIAIILLAIYFLPAIVAASRDHASAWGIFALNLLLGWTLIIWIIALIWALSNKGQPAHQTVIVHNNNNEGQQQAPPPQPIYIPVPQAPSPAQVYAQPPAPLLADMRDCPYCAETIKAAATKCRFCFEQITPTMIAHDPQGGARG